MLLHLLDRAGLLNVSKCKMGQNDRIYLKRTFSEMHTTKNHDILSHVTLNTCDRHKLFSTFVY